MTYKEFTYKSLGQISHLQLLAEENDEGLIRMMYWRSESAKKWTKVSTKGAFQSKSGMFKDVEVVCEVEIQLQDFLAENFVDLI